MEKYANKSNMALLDSLEVYSCLDFSPENNNTCLEGVGPSVNGQQISGHAWASLVPRKL